MKSRLHKDERYDQLVNLAHQMIDEEGTDALTLITLADKAGITKPITYRHFGNRKTLLYVLFQNTIKNLAHNMRNGIDEEASCLTDAIHVFTKTYMKCLSDHGKNCFAIIAALKAYPEHENIDSELQKFFCVTLASSLSPFLPEKYEIPNVTLIMIFGATCCLGNLYLSQLITKEALIENITLLITRLIDPEI